MIDRTQLIMFVKSLKLLGFRNYLEAAIEFNQSKTIIIGKNAQGKTNLLEVIQILSHVKSRRASRDSDLVHFDLGEAIIHAIAERKQEELEIALLIRRSGKRTLKINEISHKPNELLHHIFSVSFMVDDIEIINGSPSHRRDWLDSVIAQLDFGYKDKLTKFEKILAQRNSFFKELVEAGSYYYRDLNTSQQDQLMVWDELYIAAANEMTGLRANFIMELEPIAARYYSEISGSDTVLALDYMGMQIDQEALEDVRARDFARGYSNIGPHRDEIKFLLNGSLAASFASQGERRSITLAIKLAELELHKTKHGEYPILLLDDVLAELDEDRQDYLLECINPQTQVIITTTHIGKHLEKWSENAQIMEIEAGRVMGTSSESTLCYDIV
ncbi:MAG: DNA replication/repair protein RecF [Cyanobacteria bacterium]|nr:DNA replication/repair protein RecF [Cyanobacteriota bacterium]MDA1020144.1 DNA replication/repair protein RecF [Cyanobacteriota bacterium]